MFKTSKMDNRSINHVTLSRNGKEVKIPSLKVVKSPRVGEFRIRFEVDVPLRDNQLQIFEEMNLGSIIKISFKKYPAAIKTIKQHGGLILHLDEDGTISDIGLPEGKESLLDGCEIKPHKQTKKFILSEASAGNYKASETYLRADDIPDKVWNKFCSDRSSGAIKLSTDKMISSKQLSKLVIRAALSYPSHAQRIAVRTIAILCGEFGIDDTKGTCDGEFIFNANCVKDEFISMGFDKELLSPSLGVGKRLQVRPWYAVKGMGVGTAPKDIMNIVSQYSSSPICFDKATKAVMKKIHKSISNKDGSVYIIGPDKIADIFVDLNAMKILPDLTKYKSSTLNIVNIPGKSRAHTMLQMLDKLVFAVGDKAISWAEQVQEKGIKDLFDELLTTPKIISPRNLMEGEMIKSLAPQYVREVDKSLNIQVKKTLVNRLKNNICKFHWEMPGGYEFIGVDPAAYFGLRIIGDNEVWCKDLADAEEIFMIKPPAIGVKEAAVYKVLSKQEIKSRLAKIENLSIRKTIESMIFGSDRFVLLVPATDILAFKHAGLDKDGDCATAYKKKALPSFSNKFFNEAIEAKQGRIKELLVDNTLAEGVVMSILNPNIGIGMAVNMYRSINSLLYKEHNIIIDVLKNEGYTPGQQEYTSIKPVLTENGEELFSIDEKTSLESRKSFQNMKWSKDNLTRFIIDQNRIGRWFTENVIDSSKDNRTVPLHFELNKTKISGVQKTKLGIDIDEQTGELVCSFTNKEFPDQVIEFKGQRTFWLEDYSGALIRKGLESATEMMNNCLKQTPKYDAYDYGILSDLDNKISDSDYSYIAGSITLLKYMYNDLVACRSQLIAEYGDTNEGRARAKRAVHPAFTAIGNTIREICGDLTSNDMARIVKRVALTGKGNEYRTDGGSIFAETVIPAEYTKFVLDHYSELEHVGSRIVSSATDLILGDLIEFTKGLNTELGIVLKDKISGEFTIIEHEGDLYAAKHYNDAIKIPDSNGRIILKISNSNIGIVKDAINIDKKYNINNKLFINGVRLDLNRRDYEGAAIMDLLANRSITIEKIYDISCRYRAIYLVGKLDGEYVTTEEEIEYDYEVDINEESLEF